MFSRTPFFWRVFLSFTLLICLSIILAGFFLSAQISEKHIQQANSELLQALSLTAGEARDILAGQSGDSPAFATGYPDHIRLTLFDQSQRLLLDTEGDFSNLNNSLFRPELSGAGEQRSGTADRYSTLTEMEYLYQAVRLTDANGALIGFLRSGYEKGFLDSQIRQDRAAVYWNLVLAALVLLVIALMLANGVAEPVRQITRLAETVAEGDFNQRVQENRLGLGKLANAINQLARKSAERVADVTTDRNRLAAIFAGMVEGVIGVDQRMHIQHINDAAARILHLDASRSVKKPLWQEIRFEVINKSIDQAMKGREVIKTQMRLPRDYDELVVDIYAASLTNESGEALGAVLVLHDITELESLSRMRTDFVANASHELKTPITAIRGLAETILEDEDISDDDRHRFLDRIHAQSLRLSNLVSDLMTISRLESVQHEQEFLIVNLTTLVRKAVQSLQPSSEAKKQTMQVTLSQENLSVTGDRQHLNQLVDNLIDNAIKYTQEGGTIKVSLEKRDEYAVLVVADNGIGISQQYQKRIFERFYRVDKVRSQSLGGTGLGLSIVKNIVEKHFGEIELHSQPGMGTEFTVKLPLTTEPKPELPGAKAYL